MIPLSERPAKMARAAVARWFATLPSGPVFLDDRGRAFPLPIDAALALRAQAEEAVAQAGARFEWRGVLAMIGTVAVVVGSQSLAGALPEPGDAIVRAVAYALYVAHAVWALAEAVRCERAVGCLRRELAYQLRGHAPLPDAMTGSVAASNAIFGIIAAVLLAVAALTILAQVSDHHGFDMIRLIPGWMPLVAVGLICLLVAIAKYVDRRRGIGVLRPGRQRFDRL